MPMKDEGGTGLLELLVSIAINSFLLVAGTMLFMNGVNYVCGSISDWEMMEEIRQVTWQIKNDIRYSTGVKVSPTSITISGTDVMEGIERKVTYSAPNIDARKMIYRNNQPVISDSKLGTLYISKFNLQQVNDNVIHLMLEGKNSTNGHVLTLETDILRYAGIAEEGK